jgi:hypothetical protein
VAILVIPARPCGRSALSRVTQEDAARHILWCRFIPVGWPEIRSVVLPDTLNKMYGSLQNRCHTHTPKYCSSWSSDGTVPPTRSLGYSMKGFRKELTSRARVVRLPFDWT